jgi:glycosyltransferase involved in cell wall biosynthesis
VYRPLGQWAVQQADAVIAVSEWERDQLSKDFGVEATVISNGVAIDRFAGATPIERDRPYLLTVGRLEEYKGVQHVIRAMAVLPEYDLLIAGSGSYREQLEQIASEEGVASRVEFLGYVDDEALPGLYAGAEVYVTMSEFEAYGMTVAEALAAGTPCVVRNVAALQDWTQNQGVVGISAVSSVSIQRAVRSTDPTGNPTLKNRSWETVTTRLIQAAYKKTSTK